MASVKSLSISLFGLLSATLLSAPAFAQNAASVIQTSEQDAAQLGQGNVAVQGNMQSGIVTQTGVPFPFGGGINGAVVQQDSEQGVAQVGIRNTAIQGNVTTADVLQGTPGYPFYYPAPGINGATVLQGSHQDVLQAGHGNSAVQGNATDATVIQH
ncbi:MAG: hypothetical protein KME43_04630 [Myxacorys chilensis ATA2-1-KO14]|jgi:hypothetical protein|nr:hypothetical protein [Myxacorys chilensis ATA2-1-KO14]